VHPYFLSILSIINTRPTFRLNTQPPAKPARNSIAQRINAFNHNETQDAGASMSPRSITPNKSPVITSVVAEAPPSCVEAPPIVAVAVDVVSTVSTEAISEEEAQTAEDLPLAHESEQFSTIKRSPHSKTNSVQSQSPDETTSSNETDNAVYKKETEEEEEVRTKVSVTVQQSQSVKTSGLSTLERNACKL